MLKQLDTRRGVSGTVGLTVGGQVQQMSVSHLLVILDSVTTAAKLNLQVALRKKTAGTEQLVQNIPLYALAEIADLDGGVSLSAMFEKLNVGAAGGDAPEINALPFVIPLGNINLSGDDELDVTATITSAFAATDGITIALVESGLAPERIFRYVQKTNGTALFSNPRQVFIFRKSSSDANDKDLQALAAGALNVTVKAGGDTKTADARLFWGLTAALGNVEVAGPRRTAMVYKDVHGTNPGADVHVNLDGTEAGNYTCIGVEIVTDVQRAQEKAIEVAQTFKQRLQNLELNKRDVAAALRMGGAIPSSREA